MLVAEIIEALAPGPGETYLDLTAGRGGHAEALARRLGPQGTIVAVDLDAGNLEATRARVEAQFDGRFVALHGSFADAPRRLAELGLAADIALADLGFASTQIDDPQRGLSFSADGPLDMRFDRSAGPTAAHLLATLAERELTEMFRHLGEEPLAAKIARNVVRRREARPIQTTRDLASVVEEVYGARARNSRLHPATRTFMALRIAVNDELNRLAALLAQVADAAAHHAGSDAGVPLPVDRLGIAPSAATRSDDAAVAWLRPQARVGIISFHSLEDRLVKHAFADLERRSLAERVTRKPVMAGSDEASANPRSRSAKLRAVRFGAGSERDQRRARRRDAQRRKDTIVSDGEGPAEQ